MSNTKTLSIVSVILGLLGVILFISVAPTATLFCKLLWVAFYAANNYNCIVVYKSEGEVGYSPLLSLIAQAALSFALLAFAV